MILVCGANGFLGSWVCKFLDLYGFAWKGVVNPKSNLGRFSEDELKRVILSPSASWHQTILTERPQVVISCDWSGVGNNERNDSYIQMSNVIRLKKMALASINCGVDKFIAFGSQAENGPLNLVAEELHYDNPTTHYGTAKVETRKLLEKLFLSTETTFIWGRIFSTYGEMDNLNWLIPSLVKTLSSGNKFNLTSGLQEWSFLHAYDFANAIVHILNSSNASGLFNIGNTNTIKILDVAETIAKELNKNNLLGIGLEPLRSDQVLFLRPKTKNLEALGWQPQVLIEEGIISYIDWFLRGRSNFREVNISQFPK